MGENEKTENVLKRAHGDGVTPEKKRKVDDEGTHGVIYFAIQQFCN